MQSEKLFDNIRYWARRWPEREALVCKGQRLSWGELDEGSDRLAAGLAAAGVVRGDRVGILMRNRVEFVEAMIAILKAGATILPLNVRYTAAEMIHPVADATPRLILADAHFLPVLERVRAALPDIAVFTTEVVAGERCYAELRACPDPTPEPDVDGEDIAFLCYTSGTTGAPKGSMISHRAVYSGSMAKMMAVGETYEDRLLMPMPLAFTGGSIGIWRDGLLPGATSILAAEYDPGTLIDLIEGERATITTGVPVLFEKMMDHPRFADADLSSLRNAPCGGSTVTMHLLRTWQAKGVKLAQGYGQTESAGCFVTVLFGDEAERKIGSAGRPLPHLTVKLLRSDGDWAEPGEAGEILVRGPSIMSGYFNNPELSAETLKDGWLHTGDIGIMDEEGYLKIVDRSKDMLISGGLNVYPAEVERTLASVFGLEEFAVIGVPDARWGEVPMLVASDLGSIDIDALRALCRSELADYKRPKFAVAHGGLLPRTLGGKVLKSALREQYRSRPEDAVSLG